MVPDSPSWGTPSHGFCSEVYCHSFNRYLFSTQLKVYIRHQGYRNNRYDSCLLEICTLEGEKHMGNYNGAECGIEEGKQIIIISDQITSVAQSCPTLCDPMNRSMPDLPVHHQLPEFTQTHVHRVSDAIQPSHPLLSPSPPAPNPSQHQSLFQ